MLPVALTRYFADSRLEVESFTRRDKTLAIRIQKEIGPETGIITFRQVAFMSLPTLMPGESISFKSLDEIGPEFWSICHLTRDDLDPNNFLFELVSQNGPAYFVMAESISYEVIV